MSENKRNLNDQALVKIEPATGLFRINDDHGLLYVAKYEPLTMYTYKYSQLTDRQ